MTFLSLKSGTIVLRVHDLTFRVINHDPEALQSAYRLRYSVYCEEKSFLPAEDYPDGFEIDDYDDHSIHIGGFDAQNNLVATVRLVLPRKDEGLPLQDHCTFSSAHQAFSERSFLYGLPCAEISRMVVQKGLRGRGESRLWKIAKSNLRYTNIYKYMKMVRSMMSGQICIALGLYKMIHLVCKAEGIEQLFAVIEPRYYRSLCRYNIDFEKIGPAVNYYGDVVPYSINMGKTKEDLRKHSKLFHWYFFHYLDKGRYKPVQNKVFTKTLINIRT